MKTIGEQFAPPGGKNYRHASRHKSGINLRVVFIVVAHHTNSGICFLIAEMNCGRVRSVQSNRMVSAMDLARLMKLFLPTRFRLMSRKMGRPGNLMENVI